MPWEMLLTKSGSNGWCKAAAAAPSATRTSTHLAPKGLLVSAFRTRAVPRKGFFPAFVVHTFKRSHSSIGINGQATTIAKLKFTSGHSISTSSSSLSSLSSSSSFSSSLLLSTNRQSQPHHLPRTHFSPLSFTRPFSRPTTVVCRYSTTDTSTIDNIVPITTDPTKLSTPTITTSAAGTPLPSPSINMSPHHPQTLVQQASISQPEKYWSHFGHQLHWDTPFRQVLSKTPPHPGQPGVDNYTWFEGGQLNTCYNAVDRHVLSGRGNQVAVYYDSPLDDGKKFKITYQELLQKVQALAGVIVGHGLKKGDTVLIYMPMIPETMVAMLACARLGITHSVVFGGFASLEIKKRLEDSKPGLILAGSCGLEINKIVPYKELLDKAIELSVYKPRVRIFFQRTKGPQLKLDANRGELDWKDEVRKVEASGKQFLGHVSVDSQHPLFILYTSGTTGLPKGVVHDNGGYAAQTLATMQNLFGCKAGDVMFSGSDLGWIVGHSMILYGPLLLGCSTVLYEGKPVGSPDAGVFFRLIEEYKVNVLYTAPTALRAIRRVDPDGELSAKYDLSSLRGLYLAGERSDPGTIAHFTEVIHGRPVVDNWWSTESGSPITAVAQGLRNLKGELIKPAPVRQGAAGMSLPGYDVCVLGDPDETAPVGSTPTLAERLPPGTFGNIAIKLPMPPSALPGLWNNSGGYYKSYLSRFPGYFDTGDAGIIDEDGYVHVMSRTDDLIQVAGHRLSTGSFEQILLSHPAIAECCVVPLADKLKGQIPMGMIVLKFGVSEPEEEIIKETVQMVRQDLGALACYTHTYVLRRLPKTRSGKILRRTIRDIIAGKSLENKTLVVPATIEDESVLKELEDAMHKFGLVGNDGEAGKVDDTVKVVKPVVKAKL